MSFSAALITKHGCKSYFVHGEVYAAGIFVLVQCERSVDPRLARKAVEINIGAPLKCVKIHFGTMMLDPVSSRRCN